MKKILPLCLAAFVSAVLLTPALEATSRTWTNKDGKTMEAEILNLQGDTVTFRRDGRTYNYAIANLSAKDQQEARKWARENEEKIRQAEAQRKVADALKGNLVRVQGVSLREVPPADVENKRLVAFYYSAQWCGPCKAFTPDLVKFYNRIKRQHPEFEIVFVSSDRTPGAMETYMKEYRMEFPAVRYDRRGSIDVVSSNKPRGIPHLVLVDGSGRILAGGPGKGARATLREIERLLDQPSA